MAPTRGLGHGSRPYDEPMRVVFSEDARDFQRRDWTDLARVDPAGTIFHRPAFLKLYWEEFGETPDHLLLTFAEDEDGRQVAAVAFERMDDTLRFLGGTEVTDYMGPVGEPSTQTQVAKELWAALVQRDDWRSADLRGLAEDRPWLGLLREAANDEGLVVREEDDQNGIAPFLSLPPTWDGYLESLPAKLRHEIRRKAKKLEAEAGPFRIIVADPDSHEALLDRFGEIHRMSERAQGWVIGAGREVLFGPLAAAFLADLVS